MGGEDDLTAGEVALGLLTGDERAAAEARRASDPAFAAAVAGWEARLAAFFDEVEPVPPPAMLWPRIEARLPRAPAPANDLLPALRRWRAAAVSVGAIAAALAGILVMRPVPAPPAPAPTPATPQPVLIAQLPDGKGASMLALQVAPGDAIALRATAIPAGSGEPELWVIPAGGKPTSLGQFAREGDSRLVLPPAILDQLRDGATIALTLEPATGAPHAAPSGVILGTARLTRI